MSGKGKGGRGKKGAKSGSKSRSSKAGLQFPVGRIHRYILSQIDMLLTARDVSYFIQ